MAKIEIKRLGPGDASVLNRVAEEVFDAPINKKRLAAYLREPNHFLFVAVCDGEVIGQTRGMIHFQPDAKDELYIDNLGVTPAFRGQGVGRELVRALLKAGKAQGCAEAWVATERSNIPARALYESLRGKSELGVVYTYRLGAKG